MAKDLAWLNRGFASGGLTPEEAVAKLMTKGELDLSQISRPDLITRLNTAFESGNLEPDQAVAHLIIEESFLASRMEPERALKMQPNLTGQMVEVLGLEL